ncbi:MAG: hypothetical protein Salg2KO_13580 [Salibacteraceae bacterium]
MTVLIGYIDLLYIWKYMKEFILLFRGGKTSTASQVDLVEHEDSWDQWMDHLENEGMLIDGLPMRDTGVLLSKKSMQESDLSANDGLTGYLIIQCEDMDTAIELAQECPIFDFDGKVEVRELLNERG